MPNDKYIVFLEQSDPGEAVRKSEIDTSLDFFFDDVDQAVKFIRTALKNCGACVRATVEYYPG